MAEKINANLTDETKSFQQRVDEIRAVAEESLHYTKSMYEEYQARAALGRGSAEDLLAENLELSKKIYRLTVTIKRYIFWQQIFGIIKILFVIIPLIIAGIYLYPLLNNALSTYQELLEVNLPAGTGLLKQLGS